MLAALGVVLASPLAARGHFHHHILCIVFILVIKMGLGFSPDNSKLFWQQALWGLVWPADRACAAVSNFFSVNNYCNEHMCVISALRARSSELNTETVAVWPIAALPTELCEGSEPSE